MFTISVTNIIIWSILIGIIIICTIGIVIASIFQYKQEKKYIECLNIIKEKGDIKFEVKNGLTKEDIKKINKNVDVNKLMQSLYNKYLRFIEKLKNNDNNFEFLLSGTLKDFYVKKIENFKTSGYKEKIDIIDLIGYSITEYNKNRLQFRVTVTCFDYKLLNDKVVSGSNLIKLEEVFLLNYEKIANKWLITGFEKIYEKKMSE